MHWYHVQPLYTPSSNRDKWSQSTMRVKKDRAVRMDSGDRSILGPGYFLALLDFDDRVNYRVRVSSDRTEDFKLVWPMRHLVHSETIRAVSRDLASPEISMDGEMGGDILSFITVSCSLLSLNATTEEWLKAFKSNQPGWSSSRGFISVISRPSNGGVQSARPHVRIQVTFMMPFGLLTAGCCLLENSCVLRLPFLRHLRPPCSLDEKGCWGRLCTIRSPFHEI